VTTIETAVIGEWYRRRDVEERGTHVEDRFPTFKLDFISSSHHARFSRDTYAMVDKYCIECQRYNHHLVYGQSA